MSTKAQIQTLINNIADGEPNTALEVRTAYNSILNELYPALTFTKWDAPIGTVQLNLGFRYNIFYSKSGRRVYVNGTFSNIGSSGVPANTNCMAFTDVELEAFSDGVAGVNSQTFKIDGIRFRIQGGTLTNVDAIPPSTTLYVDFSYLTNP